MKHFFSAVSLWALLLGLLAPQAIQAQVPAWQSALAVPAVASLRNSATDASGNVYLVGSFTGTAVFGSFTLTSAGQSDVYVVKWSSLTNSFVWAQRAGGSGDDTGAAIAVSGTGIFITGGFNSVPATFGNVVISNSGYLNTNDVFVAKLTDAGTSASFVWAQQAGNMDWDAGVAIAVNGTSVYVTGQFTGPTIAFGTTILSGGSLFITKLTDAGTSASFTWAQRMGPNCTVSTIAINGPNIYVAGIGYGTITFNNVPPTGPFFSDISGGLFIVKLIDAGPTSSYTWVQRVVGQGATSVNATVLTVSGSSVYVGGYFLLTGATGPSVTFGSTTLVYPVGSNRDGDIYLAKLTDAGTTGSFTWASQFQGDSRSKIWGLKTNGQNLYIAGTFQMATWTFGTSFLNNASSVGASKDVFVAQLTDTGASVTPLWAQRAGGTGEDIAYGIGLSGNKILVTGSAMTPASFGTQVLSNSLSGVDFGFLASMTGNTLLGTSTPVASSIADITLSPNPAHHTATVQLPTLTGPATLTLTDALGRTLRTETASGPRHELNLAGLAPGIYALRVRVGEAQAVRRLVVE